MLMLIFIIGYTQPGFEFPPRERVLVIICLCRGITDRAVKQAMEQGAVSTRQVGRLCGAGTCCGSCRGTIAAILDESAQSPTYAVPSLGH